MRLAAIADIHGNHLALEAVLADIRAQGIDDIVNLGDMVSGPLEARRTLETLMALDAVHVLGNHDRYLIDRPPEQMGSWEIPAYQQLEQHHLDWIRQLPATRIFRDQIFLCHATPAGDEVYLLESVQPNGRMVMASREAIEQAALGIEQSLMLCAHSHLPRAVRLADGRMVVNPGSVGCPGYRDKLPFPHAMQTGTPDACYAVIERRADRWQVGFRHVPYDHDAMAALARQRGSNWAQALATGWVSAAPGG